MSTPTEPATATRVTTTQTEAWRTEPDEPVTALSAIPNVILDLDAPGQVIEGFGANFSELGWTSLARLSDQARDDVLREVFTPGVGAGLTLCRMPIGANDFSRDWYSYDETPGDFAVESFDISNDLDTLVPFIRAAQEKQPGLRIWASPWSPPTWMKTNDHYAGAQPHPFMAGVENGLPDEGVRAEGTNMFRLEEPYLRAYAEYFGRFVDAYAELGIPIQMVMPQNEFNSPQVFPSCTWTSNGLTQFLRYLGPQMRKRDVDLFVGTLERRDDRLVGDVLADPEVAALVSGIGVQWEGKGAIAALHRLHPELRIYQTEQECGDGRNDWRHARHAWSLMKHFFNNGANAYMYWNISLLEGGRSRWGWTQNSLVVVDPETRTHRFTHEYQILKHVSAHVRPGARLINTISPAGYDNQLAFLNRDGSLVVIIQNDMNEEMPVTFMFGHQMISPVLPPDSFTTFVLPAGVVAV